MRKFMLNLSIFVPLYTLTSELLFLIFQPRKSVSLESDIGLFIDQDAYGRIPFPRTSQADGFTMASSPSGARTVSNPYGYQQLFSGRI